MRKKKSSSFRGQDLVEFALVLPLLGLIIFGVLDLGRLFHAGITITNAARVGARIGALRSDIYDCDPTMDPACDPTYGPPYFINATREEAANNSIDLSTSPITVECLDGNSDLGFPGNGRCDYGDTFRITVTYDFQLLLDGVISLPNIVFDRSVDMLVQ